MPDVEAAFGRGFIAAAFGPGLIAAAVLAVAFALLAAPRMPATRAEGGAQMHLH